MSTRTLRSLNGPRPIRVEADGEGRPTVAPLYSRHFVKQFGLPRVRHAELTQRGWMKDDSEFHPGDIHGQLMFNYRHPHIRDGQEGEFILQAFQRDFFWPSGELPHACGEPACGEPVESVEG